ncbi:hypothetical protein [Saccharopolyspora spinosa]|uniref:Uncharacterized protein n=1 Tax=Saccharopolyspora spinosa TaxID=60894 RepID=A0A2N3XS04_SACSN|nr:hypothetical protein [Saccharopolyspora spinosa]PKW13429.1 hypothetical protein A8926_0956 [Saccharopolyspora spinosa]
MSRRDRRTAAARRWRLLTRALVVTGATVAGTSAAWLIGCGLHADAADLPSAAPADQSAPRPVEPPESTVDGSATGRSGPAGFSLARLDPVALVRSDPAGRLLDAARPVTGVLQESATGVGHVADDALSTTGTQAAALSTSVDNGLDGLAGPLLSGETGQQSAYSPPAPPASAPAAAPVVPLPTQLVEHRHSVEQPESVVQRRAPEPGETPGNRDWSRPFALPAPSGAPSCGGTGDGPQLNNAPVGCYPAEPDRTPALAGAPARTRAGTLISVPEPQPGTTPD